jgi:hypothetical protein
MDAMLYVSFSELTWVVVGPLVLGAASQEFYNYSLSLPEISI